MKELKGAILSQNHRRSQETGAVGPSTPQLKCHQWQKFDKKPCFFNFSFFEHLCVQQYRRSTVINNK